MERDFLGLSSRTVKEEITDLCKDHSVPVRGSAMQWSFGNKVSVLPQFMSFKAAQEDRTRKTGYDSLPSIGFMTVSSAEAFDSNHKAYSAVMQKNSTFDTQAGSGAHYSFATYPPQHFDAHSVHRPHEVKILPIPSHTNQMISVSMNAPVHQSLLASVGQNGIGSTANTHPLAVPVMAPNPSSVVGTTDLRNTSKTPGAPAQLTIFYAGSVCVYDDVSPEKAQAIMLLAGNGPSATPATTLTTAQVQPARPKPSASDGFVRNQSQNNLSCQSLPSPISVTSRTIPQSAAGSSYTNDKTVAKPVAPNKPEPSKVAGSLGSVPSTMIPPAVPQARKASLARFLERRKERVISATPYACKQNPDCGTPRSESRSYSTNSAGSCPFPDIN